MLDLASTKTTNKPHAQLSDLIKLQSDDAGSGASTPPLWHPESPESRRKNYASMSPRSRTEAIARGQMELMEMVKNMPESCYELSLKDLVEVNRVSHQGIALERDDGKGQNGSYVRRGGPRAHTRQQHRQHVHSQMVRSGSLDGNSGGFLLKMVFPIVPWGTRKKKKKIAGFDANSGNNGVNSDGASEKEWWRTRSSLSTASARGESLESGMDSSSLNSGSRKSSTGSGSSSNNSNSSSRSNSSGRRHDQDSDCWSFMRTNKSKSQN